MVYLMGFIGSYYADLGQADKAVQWLSRAFSISPVAFDFRLLDTELFDRIRDNPVFTQGVAAIKQRVRDRFAEPLQRFAKTGSSR